MFQKVYKKWKIRSIGTDFSGKNVALVGYTQMGQSQKCVSKIKCAGGKRHEGRLCACQYG